MAKTQIPENFDRITPIAVDPMPSLWNAASWILCGVILILWGLRLWGYGTLAPMVTIPSTVLIAWGLGLLVWHGGRQTSSRKAQWVFGLTLVLTLIALGIWSYTQVLTIPAYGTDEMAFDQYAAQLWVHGIDPYGRSLAAAFARYQVSPNGYTWTLTGAPVTLLSYPALSFEIYVPFLLMGWSAQLAVWMNIVFWAAGLVLLALGVPRSVRPLVIVLASLSVYISYAVGGVTDALFVPFLVLAARAWDQYPLRRGWAAFWSPFWFGLAMGIKQTPWVLLPFLLLGIGLEGMRTSGRWRDGLSPAIRYALITGGVFILPNIPFILKNPVSWIHGILAPLMSSTVPAGQGLITLSLFLHIGGGSLLAYTVLSLVILFGLLVLYVLTYPRMKAWTFLLPSVVLFFATRSFGSYLVMLVPSTLMALLTTNPSTAKPLTHHTRWAVMGIGGAMVAGLTAALGIPSPMDMQLVGVHTTGQLATVDQVEVAVHNATNRPLRPYFTADISGTLTAFWQRLEGPQILRPHQSAVYTLAAPNFYAQPPLTGGFQMVGFTARTKTVSHTRAYVPTT
ncbi:MAG: hypothetical protein C7B44_15105 [Sulfobacillus thermosulfidooxidans]|nr:MAG: hypothetical protein C7B44_15105 [Sulfobacillus thermosulfidooxidans]